MAQVATNVRPPVDRALDYLAEEWARMPEVVAEWDEWEEHERLDFVLEWPLREDRLRQIEGWSAAGLLEHAQRQRYDDLLVLIRRHRPSLDRLLAD